MSGPESGSYRDDERMPEGSVNAFKIAEILSLRKGDGDSEMCVSELLAYANEIIDNDEQFYSVLMDRDIIVKWELPAHQQQVSVTKHTGTPPKELGCKVGVFTPPEIKILSKNWNKLCRKYDISDQPESFARWRSDNTKQNYNPKIEQTRRQIVKWLAKGLNRTLFQVFNGFVNYYTRYRVGPYNKREKRVMKIIFKWAKHNGGLKTVIEMKLVRCVCILLCRDKRGVQMFMSKVLNKNSNAVPGDRRKWTLKRSTDLLNAMMDVFPTRDINNFKNVTFDSNFWKKVAAKTNDKKEWIRLFWYRKLHLMLFVKGTINMLAVRVQLCKIFDSMDIKYFPDINFRVVCEKFPPGYTPLFLKSVISGAIMRSKERQILSVSENRKIKISEIQTALMDHKDEKVLCKARLNSQGILEFYD